MSNDNGNNGRPSRAPKPLVTVERQVEQDLFTGERTERRFVKMYFEARESGLLADIPDDLWKTLCALATYVDDQSYCFPSQETIGRDLGISRQAANGRMKRLREYRFNGQAVLEVRRERVRSAKGQTRWGKNVYKLLPLTGFHVGRGAPESSEVSMSRQTDIEDSVSMSGQPDIEELTEIAGDSQRADLSMSGSMSSQSGHKQEGTRIRNTHTPKNTVSEEGVCKSPDGFGETEVRSLVAHFHKLLGSAPSRRPTSKELEQGRALLGRLGGEQARFVVEFAVREAPKTKFEMKHFGAVLGYEDDALQAHLEHEQQGIRRAQAERKQREEELEGKYYRWRQQVIREAIEAMDPEKLEAAKRRVRAQVAKERGEKCIGFEGLVRVELSELVAAEKGIMPFREWRQSEYPRLRAG